ncbi:hypothetical protein MSAN_01788800 [Mycena sanguinolenta]|uniref:Uncharacterized protein n=1 Tax=Mycena sanguinolenta TaxID=230812 RepID=A0A8H6XUG6_9AGAR|nr:hypothetical protein MSAN_01788800 [Mycena sanguinolenta]
MSHMRPISAATAEMLDILATQGYDPNPNKLKRFKAGLEAELADGREAAQARHDQFMANLQSRPTTEKKSDKKQAGEFTSLVLRLPCSTDLSTVYANAEQLKILQAAVNPDRNFTTEECEKLSSETGLTCAWIKSWLTRYKKKLQGTNKRVAKSEPEDPPPPKRGRLVHQPKIESPPPGFPPAPVDETLPPLDDSYLPPAKSINSTSVSDQKDLPQPFVSHPPSGAQVYTYHSSFLNYQPPQRPFASHPQQSAAHAQQPRSPDAILPRQSENASAYQNNPPRPFVLHPAPATHVYHSSFSNYQPPVNGQQRKSVSRSQQQQSPSSSAMLLPRQSQNIDPALQPNAWNAGNWFPYDRPVRNPSPGLPFGSTAVAGPRPSLFVGNQLPPPHVAVNRLEESLPMNPYKDTLIYDTSNQLSPPHVATPRLGEPFSNKNTPIRDASLSRLHSPCDSSFSKQTHTPSKHNRENEGTTTTATAPDTPIDDKFLFSSMLNLTPKTPAQRATPAASVSAHDTSLFDLEIKHLPILNGGYIEGEDAVVRKMTLDEMHERLLSEDLASSDPFQAAMGLVFMSRTGLHWEC